MSARLRLIARRVALVIVAAALIVTVLALAVHLPWVEDRVAAWAASRLEAGGIRVRTSSLRYNLASRRVHVEGLVVSTTADPQHPFLEAARLDIALPRSVWTGRIGITSFEAERLRLTFLRRQDGSTNFPQDRGTSTSSVPASFPIGAVTLQNASFIWRDEMLGMDAAVNALSLALHPTAAGTGGALAIGQPATFRIGEHTTSITARAQIAWDGARLSFDSLLLQAPEATLAASGAAALLGSGSSIAVDATGSADVDRVSAWFVVGDRPAGRMTFRARAAGTLASPAVDVTLTSQNLAWQGLTGVAVDAAAHVDGRALDTTRFSVRALGGTAAGRGHLSFADAPERARASIDWHDLDAGRLLAALGVKVPARIETLLDGRATASLAAWRADALTADVEATSRSMRTDGRAMGLGGSVTLEARTGEWRGSLNQWVNRAVHITGRGDGRLAASTWSSSTVSAAVTAAADSSNTSPGCCCCSSFVLLESAAAVTAADTVDEDHVEAASRPSPRPVMCTARLTH